LLAADIELCIHDDTRPTDTGGSPTTMPIVMTSLFSFPTLARLQAALATESRTHVYTRGQNPTVEYLEQKIARLERGEACKCFGSGMAAISAVMLGTLRAGDHILFVNQTYGPTIQLARQLAAFGIGHDLVLDLAIESIEAAIRPNTRLIWLESPGTMTFRLLDLHEVAALARRRGIVTCIDNSWATPLLQKPIPMGIDIVVHTCTKYLNGHSDVMGGAVVSTTDRMQEIFYRAYLLNGGILSPHDAWLMLRGMRTLPARLRQHGADALQVATALRRHPAIGAVHHPAFNDATLAERQFSGYAGVFSFELVRDDAASVHGVVDALRHFRIGVSWGGVESLVIAPATGKNEDRLAEQRIPRGLIRLSIGLEGADLLLDDLHQALGSLA
jgi:cystathionine beta-lyase/cystathionine gamma-synthase